VCGLLGGQVITGPDRHVGEAVPAPASTLVARRATRESARCAFMAPTMILRSRHAVVEHVAPPTVTLIDSPGDVYHSLIVAAPVLLVS
jgi:hypothetical protein